MGDDSSVTGPTLLKATRGDRFCDIQIKCGGVTFRVHRLVVSTASPVFERAFSSEFQEGVSGSYEVTGFDVETVDYMLDFIYHGEYRIKGNTSPDVKQPSPTSNLEQGVETLSLRSDESSSKDLMKHLNVIEAADVYHVDGLEKAASEHISHILSDNWTADSFIEVVKRSCSGSNSRNPNLRAVLVSIGSNHADELMNLESFKQVDNASFLHEFYHGTLRETRQRMALLQQAEERLKKEFSQKAEESAIRHERNKIDFADQILTMARRVFNTVIMQRRCTKCRAKQGYEIFRDGNKYFAGCYECGQPKDWDFIPAYAYVWDD
ncbi:hypothetical protein KEM55_006400 [Ascosphaera atra]|nr:hypothetical protein KEM55_006400 [Ascosphaera atra]